MLLSLASVSLAAVVWLGETRRRNPDALIAKLGAVSAQYHKRGFLGPDIRQYPTVRQNPGWLDRLVGDTTELPSLCRIHNRAISPELSTFLAKSDAASCFKTVKLYSVDLPEHGTPFLKSWQCEPLELDDIQLPKSWQQAIVENESIQHLFIAGESNFSIANLRSMPGLKTLAVERSSISEQQLERLALDEPHLQILFQNHFETKIVCPNRRLTGPLTEKQKQRIQTHFAATHGKQLTFARPADTVPIWVMTFGDDEPSAFNPHSGSLRIYSDVPPNYIALQKINVIAANGERCGSLYVEWQGEVYSAVHGLDYFEVFDVEKQ